MTYWRATLMPCQGRHVAAASIHTWCSWHTQLLQFSDLPLEAHVCQVCIRTPLHRHCQFDAIGGWRLPRLPVAHPYSISKHDLTLNEQEMQKQGMSHDESQTILVSMWSLLLYSPDYTEERGIFNNRYQADAQWFDQAARDQRDIYQVYGADK